MVTEGMGISQNILVWSMCIIMKMFLRKNGWKKIPVIPGYCVIIRLAEGKQGEANERLLPVCFGHG